MPAAKQAALFLVERAVEYDAIPEDKRVWYWQQIDAWNTAFLIRNYTLQLQDAIASGDEAKIKRLQERLKCIK